ALLSLGVFPAALFADGSGTGFVLAKAGYVATNYHVVADATEIQVFSSDGRPFTAAVARKDTTNDLVLLRVSDPTFSAMLPGESPFVWAANAPKLGEDCFTLGFPLGDIMGTTARFSSGVVDSVFGLQDDPRLLQISNPIQPGNSGGPLLNRSGELI